MENWKNVRSHLLKDKIVAAEYKRLAPRYKLISQLIEMRLKRKLTQLQLAKKINTKQSAIARIESGSFNPNLGFLEKIAQALNTSLEINFTSPNRTP